MTLVIFRRENRKHTMKRRITLYVILGVVLVAAAVAGILIWSARRTQATGGETLTAVVDTSK